MKPSPAPPAKDSPISGERIGRYFHRLCSGLAAGSFALVLVLLTGREAPGQSGWPEALLLVTATAATLTALARQLPLQNTMFAAAIIGAIGSFAHAIGATTAMPFGPFHFTEAAGPRLLDTLAWFIPLLWILVVLNSRGVARLILRPWRKLRAYGLWLMGLTTLLTVLLAAALEPFGGLIKQYWLWETTRLPLTWCGAPLTNFLGWLVTTILIMAFATPVLIDKRARPTNRPPDYHPLLVWLMALLLCASGTGLRQAWLATGYILALAVISSALAIRGARW